MTKQRSVLEGREVARKHFEIVSKKIQNLRKSGVTLTLATVKVGNSKDTELYARSLERLLQKLGVHHLPSASPEKIKQEELLQKITTFNADPTVTGILVFSPLPPSIHSTQVLNAVGLLKDVEGRRALTGFSDRVVSPTANAVLALLEETGIDAAGKEAVVIGHSDVVGKPTSILLLDKMATVTVCHAKTNDLKTHVLRADIVVAAAGKPHLVKGDWIKKGAVVIDVGENVVDGELVGDVEFEKARPRARFISPVPGGVGPVTNVMLVKNLIKLHELQRVLNANS